MKTCSIVGCENKHNAKGYCCMHYGRFKRHGDPLVDVRPYNNEMEILERLDLYLKKTDDCWLWVGYKNKGGYGCISIHGKTELAHRVIWGFEYGELNDDDCVLHHCDTPACCRPSHLFKGDRYDNNIDRTKKGRSARGEGCHLSKLTNNKVIDIRSRFDNGETRASIARLFSKSFGTIHAIVKRKTWKHI